MLALAVASMAALKPPRFADDFESGLARWTLTAAPGVRVIDSGDPAHEHVLLLSPNGDVHAVIKGSEQWGKVRIEGDVQFPVKADSYLGVMYNFQQHGARTDFGLIYIKGRVINARFVIINVFKHYGFAGVLHQRCCGGRRFYDSAVLTKISFQHNYTRHSVKWPFNCCDNIFIKTCI